ncbi:MAG: minichromosome maintenance protein MCM [Nanoarchaeota archaeon]|nr:minichromosome maintenance protein MCM [Nanoarchaeota archaeon]MBU1030608.1 minichromosome maintenance protein MCM [Nanoarchaeota archaeon]MBU1849838.1 minichromosome maintenance protein MCM [Nanoarchaeota archaeon]
MDVSEQINKFQEFLENNYYESILQTLQKGEESLIIDFPDLMKFNADLADNILETPEEILKVAQNALENLHIEGDTTKISVRFKHLPESQQIKIRHIRSKHINKFLQIEGIVRQKTDVRPQVTSARFECPSCGNIINILQLDSKFKEPTRCSCGRSGKFRMISKELVDAQKLVLEEAPEDLSGGEQPKRLNIFLKKDLVSPITEKKTNPGGRIIVVGYIKEIPIILASGGKSTRFDLIDEANYVEPVQEDFSDLQISKKEIKEIKKLSEDPEIYEKLVNSIAPTIYGHEKVKEALLLQMMGGCRKKNTTGVSVRGDMHILLIGDPGSGKSQLLKRISNIAPKARFVSGKGASGVGLTASVVKDEFLRGWALEAGALVLANGGLCCIDELDKMSTEDRSAMHEALEQQTVTISKANIQATLRAETTVLAAANPKFGRFDPYELLAKQIELPSTLINRFDLIFPIRDIPDKVKDEKLASFILNMHLNPMSEKEDIEPELLKKYVAYARQQVFPKLSPVAMNEIKDFYVQMRNTASEEGTIATIPISARQLEALIRLSEASARTRLSDKITKKDAQKAIELLYFCLSQIGVDPETGKIDIDRITTGITASERSHIAVVREIINDLEKAIGKTIPVEDVIREAEIKGVNSEKVEDVLEKLKRKGDIFSPRQGLISKI